MYSQAAIDARAASRQVSSRAMAVGPSFWACHDSSRLVDEHTSMQSRSARKQRVTSPLPSIRRHASAQSSLTATSASHAATHRVIPVRTLSGPVLISMPTR